MKFAEAPPPRSSARWSLVGWLAVALSAAGCKVSSLDESESELTRNECESDGDCSGGICGDGICRATSSEVEHLLLEIVLPSETGSNAQQQQLSNVRYLKALSTELQEADLRRANNLELELNPIVQVNGIVRMPPRDNECSPGNGQQLANLKLRFTPTEQILGLPATTYSTDAVPPSRVLVEDEELGADDLAFRVNVPPGRYDIYAEVVDAAENCFVNSRLFRGRRIALDLDADEVVDEATLDLNLAPATLALDIVWPRDEVNLDHWTVDIVDDRSGLPISTQVTLGDNRATVGSGYEYGVLLHYTPVEYPTDEESPGEALELVRLSPPDDVIAPTIYIPRQALELFEKGAGTINHLTELPPVVSVEGQVDLEHDEKLPMPCAGERVSGGANPCAVPVEVRIVAAEPREGAALTGLSQLGPGTMAYFERTATTTDALTFPVQLLPGDYRVIAVPELDPERPWASTEALWSVSDVRDQAGKTVRLRPRARVEGSIRTPNRARATGFEVTLRASLEELGYFASQIGEVPFVPRTSLGATSTEGVFSVRSDYGTFDVSVRPSPETGFAWQVLPSVAVTRAIEELGTVQLSWPAVYSGTVSSLGAGELPGAVIRAYAYFDSEGELVEPAGATSVVQVGETRVDDDGTYRLLIPSRLGSR